MTKNCKHCFYCETVADTAYCLLHPLYTEICPDDEGCYLFTRSNDGREKHICDVNSKKKTNKNHNSHGTEQ